MIVKHRRGTTKEWREVDLDLIPEAGELVIEECDDGTRRCKIGTGDLRFSELPYIDDKTKASLLLEIAKAKAELENKITNADGNFAAELNSLENEINVISGKYYEVIDDYTSRDANLEARLSKGLAEAVERLNSELASIAEQSKTELGDIQAELVHIEEQVGSIEKALEAAIADNANRLEAKSSELADDYITRDANIRATLSKNIAETAESLNTEIDIVAEDLKNTQVDLQNKTDQISSQIKDIKEDFDIALAEQTNSFNVKCSELTSDYIARDTNTKATLAKDIADTASFLTNEITSVREHSKEVQSSLYTEAARIDAQIDATEKAFTAALSDTTNSFNDKCAELANDYVARDSVIKATLDKTIANAVESLNHEVKTVAEFSKETQSQLQTEVARIDAHIADTEKKFAEAFVDNDKNITAKCAELTNDYVARDAGLKAAVDKNLADTAELLDNKITSVAEHSKEVQLSLQTETARIDGQIKATKEDFETVLANQEKNFNTRCAELSADYITRDANVKALLTQDLTDAVELLDSKITSAVEETNASLQTETSQIKAEMAAIEESLSATLTDQANTIKTKCADITTDYITRDANIEARLTQNITNTANLLQEEIDTVAEQSNKVQKNLQTETARIDDQIKANKEAIETALVEQSNRFTAKCSELTNDYIIRDANLKAVLQNDLTEAISEVNTHLSTLDDHCRDLTQADKELAKTVDSKYAELTEAFTEKDTAIEKAFNTKLSESVIALKADLANHATAAAVSREALKADVETKVAKLATDIESATSELSQAIVVEKAEREAAVNELQQTFTEADNTIQALTAEINKTSANLNARVTNVAANINEISETLDNHIAETEGLIKQNLNERIETLQTALTEQITAVDGKLSNSIEAVRTASDTKFAELEETIAASPIADGLHYENNELWLTCKGSQVGNSVTITGGTGVGGGYSTVTVTNNLPSDSFTVSKDTETWINFTYTSFRNEVQTPGDGTCSVSINEKNIPELFCRVQHGVPKSLELTKYLESESNIIAVTCMDKYGTLETLYYSVNVVELGITSTFNSTQIFDTNITFRYKVFGQSEKTVYVLIDGDKVHEKSFTESQIGNSTETTVLIPKQPHGCHKITAYAWTTASDGSEIPSNTLTYEIICTDANADNKTALLTSSCATKQVTQGDLVSISYMVYDDASDPATVNLNVYTNSNGIRTKIDEYCDSRIVDRAQQFWNIRNYPIGPVIFEVSYTYNYLGDTVTISREHEVTVAKLDLNVSSVTDSLQLYLHANGRSNDVANPAVWEFTRKFLDPDGKETEETITTAFEGFNWKSNGWDPDKKGEPVLRLNGDARAVINFKPFETDFKTNGKTIEFDFAVRDVNNREAIVIDCFEAEVDPVTGKETDNGIGFRATPDTAFLKSSDTEVSCRYKDGERVRVAISVEDNSTTSQFVSIYLDGVLSGIQKYTTNTTFSQSTKPQKIILGSPYCGLDIYNIRIYDKALDSAEILNNYIADQTSPATKQQLVKDNDILDADGKVSYEKVKALGNIPIITFTGSMPTYKDDKKVVLMDFENPLDPARSFSKVYGGPIQVEIDVQGTSSQYYIRKNWKIKLEKKAKDANGDTLKDANGKTVYEFKNAAYQHMKDEIPAKVFCIKVDYAEATGTHNTGTANYVETFYDRAEVTLPPQKDDERVRTTIAGFPCIIFEKATEDSEPVFSSKGNFNYDKGAEGVFGFTEDYDNYGVECWEFKNNTSDAVNFAGEIPAAWEDDFEPRYVPEARNFERIEKLLKQRKLAPLTDDEAAELATLQSACIPNFKEMHDWVRSTATFDLEQIYNADGKIIDTKKVMLSEEVRRQRLDKFKDEFTNYFNIHYSCIYYVYTFFALMTDQRAKNMFLTRWQDGETEQGEPIYHWYPYFYDNDTIFGINNEGALVFDYYHEDTDQLGSSNVYNGQNSVLWNNFRECFQDKIQETYAKLRSEKKLGYDAVINSYVTQGSDKWSAAIYNADADYKYVTMAREHVDHTDEEGNKVTGLDASNLYQVRGPGEHHLRYFVANRLNYCDSKWNAGDYPSDFFFLRIYTPQLAEITEEMSEEKKAELTESNNRIKASLEAVPANPSITVTPFSDMYAGVKYGASSTLIQKRMSAGNSFTFTPRNAAQKFNDTETAVYGASSVASLGDLSGLYCGVVNLVGKNTDDASATQGNVKENKLIELIVGNENANYYNDNFREIEVGTCRLLQKIDLRNCSGLGKRHGIAGEKVQTSLKLAGCPNIEEIYTEGTNLESVELPDGGYVKILHLPASTNTLVIKNQKYISDFSIESYKNLRTLQIENSNLNTAELLENCRDANGKYTVVRVSLTDVQLGDKENPVTADFIKSLIAKYDSENALISGIRGLGDDKQAYIKGTCYIAYISGEVYAEIKSCYKELTINFGTMESVVTFSYHDAAGVQHLEEEKVFSEDSQCGEIKNFEPEQTPAWPENDAFRYEFIGWSQREQLRKHPDDENKNWEEDSKYETDEALRKEYPDAFNGSSLTNIAGNRTLYPVFKAIRKSYIITFQNPTAPKGPQVLAEISTPYGSDANYDTAVYPIPTKQDSTSPELYTFTGWYPAPVKITESMTCDAQFTFNDEKWYTIGISDITDCRGPNDTTFDGYTLNTSDKTMSITECTNNYNAAIAIPNTFVIDANTFTVTKLGGFSGHDKLELVRLPEKLLELLSNAFSSCVNLNEITLPKSLQRISDRAFQSCTKLQEITIPKSVIYIGDAAIAECTNLKKIIVEAGNTRYEVREKENCLIDKTNKRLLQGLANGVIPQDADVVTNLGFYCFASMPITTIQIPDNITTISDNAFSRCAKLKKVELPNTIKTLGATCFAWCSSLADINLPEGLTDIMTYVFYLCPMEEIVIPSTINNILDRAFCEAPNLKTVTFKKALTDNGTIKVPYIHSGAFYGTGKENTPVVFNCPWSEAQHKAEFEGVDGEGKVKDPTFGANYCIFNFDYEEAN